MKRRDGGFTIIELLIVLVVMVILLTLAIVNLRSSEANSRDHERETDVAAMMTLLETYYNVRSSESTGSGQGIYPATGVFGLSESALKSYFPDVPPETLRAPNIKNDEPISFVPAGTNATYISSGSYATLGRPTLTTYIYQALKDDGSLCTVLLDDCTHYVIYYAREGSSPDCTGAGSRFCSVESKQ